jgi:hypothetical protein
MLFFRVMTLAASADPVSDKQLRRAKSADNKEPALSAAQRS